MSSPILHRIVPLTGTEGQRQVAVAQGLLLENELHTTKTQRRLFLRTLAGDYFMGPSIVHGGVSDEAGMLATNATSPRGCWPGDSVFRSDTNSEWRCISNNGELVTDWESTLTIEDFLSGGVFDGTPPADVESGGDFVSTPSGGIYGGAFEGSIYGGGFI